MFEQWPYGVRVPKGQEQPGDLVFFNARPGSSADSAGHVGIVIGGAKMIEALALASVPSRLPPTASAAP